MLAVLGPTGYLVDAVLMLSIYKFVLVGYLSCTIIRSVFEF